MLKDELPDDLVEFLESDRRLEYDASACEIGVFALRSLEEVEEIELTVSAEDHQSTCTIRALDLVKSCEVYDPRGMLVYIPSLRKYGSYDSELQVLITYRGISWSDFLADPARHINAAWDSDPEIAEETFLETAADRTVEVASAANGLEAHGLCAILEERGIRTQVVGETLGTAAGGLPLGEAIAPRIWVREGDARRAREIIEEFRSRSHRECRGSAGTEEVAFLCQECGSSVAFPAWRRGHVETCPQCGNYLDVPDDKENLPPDGPALAESQQISESAEWPKSAASGLRTTTQLWIEVLAVLSLAYVFDLLGAIATITGWLPARPPSPFTYRMAYLIIRSLQVSMPVLVIVALSGDPWKRFGIVRPRWITDALLGCATWLIASAARHFILSLLPRSMLEGLASAYVVHRPGPEGMGGFLLLLVAEAANGFAEELVMRAYLITRLQRLFSSTWLAVVVTTALFASYHAYQGPLGVISAAAGGLVYALAFCWFRRLWPLCVAHAIYNISLQL